MTAYGTTLCRRAVRGVVLALALSTAAVPAFADDDDGKGLVFWNITAYTIDGLYLAKPGTQDWGPNLTLNDEDKTVEADERIGIGDVAPGVYDVKISDVSGRTCIAKNVKVKVGGKYAFAIDEQSLTDCKQR